MTTWFLETTAAATILAVVVAILNRTLRLPPASRHALWVVVLLKLMLPPMVRWEDWRPQPASPKVVSTSTDAVGVASVPPSRHPTVVLQVDEEPASQEAAAIAEALRKLKAEQERITASPATPSLLENLRTLAAGACEWWFVGAVAVVGFELVRVLRQRRRFRREPDAPDDLRELVEDISKRMRVRPPRVVASTSVRTPCVWCVGRPILLWPISWLGEEFRAKRAAVVAHELAHLARRDHRVAWLELAARTLWWWNPLYWIVCGRIHEEAEEACDAWVVWALPEQRQLYAAALVDACAATVRRPRLLSWTAADGANVLGMGRRIRSRFERRLRMILNFHTPHRLTVGAFLLACSLGLVAAPMWLGAQNAPKTDAKSSDKRIAELEKKLDVLLTEMRASKAQQPPLTPPLQFGPPSTTVPAVPTAALPPPTPSSYAENAPLPAGRVGEPAPVALDTTYPVPSSTPGAEDPLAKPVPQKRPPSQIAPERASDWGVRVELKPAANRKTVTYSVAEFPKTGENAERNLNLVAMTLEALEKNGVGVDILVDASDDKVLRVFSSAEVIGVLDSIQALGEGKIGAKGKIRRTASGNPAPASPVARLSSFKPGMLPPVDDSAEKPTDPLRLLAPQK